MVKNLSNIVVLETNIFVSALMFGGKPGQVMELASQKVFSVVTSPVLLGELVETLSKKFDFDTLHLRLAEKKIKQLTRVVQPTTEINVVRDTSDNRVLETAVEGKAQYIVTGDSDLLDLKQYKNITILTVTEFLRVLEGK